MASAMRLPNELVTQGPCIVLDANWRGLLLDVEPVAQYSRRIFRCWALFGRGQMPDLSPLFAYEWT